jgi:hypothetical protein
MFCGVGSESMRIEAAAQHSRNIHAHARPAAPCSTRSQLPRWARTRQRANARGVRSKARKGAVLSRAEVAEQLRVARHRLCHVARVCEQVS